jgi:hypothetical protein
MERPIVLRIYAVWGDTGRQTNGGVRNSANATRTRGFLIITDTAGESLEAIYPGATD